MWQNSADSGKLDLAKVDAFSKNPALTSQDISVMGVKLGDLPETVYDRLGKPDIATPYEPNILNLEYSKSLDMQDIGLLIHFEAGIVTRITIMAPFNKYLKGSTKIQYDKEELFRKFGNPSESKLGYPFKEYDYDSRKITFIIDKNDQVGLSFYL